MPLKIAMIGAGSLGFAGAVARELVASETLKDSEFAMMDIAPEPLEKSLERVRGIVEKSGSPLKVTATTDRVAALKNCDYVVTACEKKRVAYWMKDIEIPQRHGVEQLVGENGGPGGQIHAMRNITLFMDIAADMQRYCPEALLLNFTNPMSFICEYMARHTPIRTVGMCHQIHGSMGVVGELLGFAPGELQVIAAGINHMAWLLDIRKRGSSRSFMPEFLQLVRQSPYWKKNEVGIPPNMFTLDVLDALGCYPVGYDNHIVEFMPYFYPASEWGARGYVSKLDNLRKYTAQGKKREDMSIREVMELSLVKYPFPKDQTNPYYNETACAIMEALETGAPTYLDSTVVVNRGAIANLPHDAVVDVPTVTVGGGTRGISVGNLPPAAAELCRRQITIHELVVRATVAGDRALALQAMCLDPWVRDLKQARAILDDYLEYYKEDLPSFKQ